MVPPCAGCQGITDAGLQAFSDALKSNNSVTSVNFGRMCEMCVAACRTDDGGVGPQIRPLTLLSVSRRGRAVGRSFPLCGPCVYLSI